MKLSQVGEFGLIRHFVSRLPKNSNVLTGIGDDCAVVRRPRNHLLLTTDMLLEGVHFRRDWMSLEEIGAKSLLVNLSDIAAMGGTPLYALVSVGLPKRIGLKGAVALFRAMRRVAEKEGVSIVGGDTNASKNLVVNIVLVGEASGPRILTRRGTRVGDSIFVTGHLGDSTLGLEALKKKKRSGYGRFIRRHFSPPSRVAIGQRLASWPGVHSLIDLSDGLLGDLGHILEESGVGAQVELAALPVSPGFAEGAKRLWLDPKKLALQGGEDYELLFTAGLGTPIPKKIGGIPITKIGTITPSKTGVRIIGPRGRPYRVAAKSFTHFSR